MGTRGRRHRLLPALARVLALAWLLALTGCSSEAGSSPPTGIDELVIPTPSIDPTDFVGVITNPWLPLKPGATWTYQVTTQVTGAGGTMTVTVEPKPVNLADVRATVVVTSGAGSDVTDFYAQDRSGNVWWLGREGVWRAGVDGAEAGLAMPAKLRNGDGWREGYLKGVVEDRAQIVNVDDSFKVLERPYTHVLDLLTTSDLDTGTAQEASYVAGVGLVRSFAVTGQARLVELVSGPQD